MTVIEPLKTISDVVFLALTLWREARGEPHEVKVGIAFSILNRVRRPAWWGNDVQTVVTKRWQYSSLTDPRDPQLTTWPQPADATWWECMQVARDLLHGAALPNPVPGADSYYDTSIPAPKWATPDLFVGQLGRVRFYNTDRDHEAASVAGKPA